jgi:HTH-type transcriptional regulator, cell division transcriptional repressor
MPPSSVESVADRIVRAREAAGFSTAQLARRMGVRTRTLTAWETGRAEPRANRLVMMAGVLNVSPTWLLIGRGAAPNEADSELALIRGELAQLRAMQTKAEQIIDRLEAHVATLESRARAAAEE